VYNHIGLEPKHNAGVGTLCIGNLKFGEMEFGGMKQNTSNWSNFCMLLCRAGLSASAGLSCYPRDAMLARVIAIATCLSVCHERVLCQNEES